MECDQSHEVNKGKTTTSSVPKNPILMQDVVREVSKNGT